MEESISSSRLKSGKHGEPLHVGGLGVNENGRFDAGIWGFVISENIFARDLVIRRIQKGAPRSGIMGFYRLRKWGAIQRRPTKGALLCLARLMATANRANRIGRRRAEFGGDWGFNTIRKGRRFGVSDGGATDKAMAEIRHILPREKGRSQKTKIEIEMRHTAWTRGIAIEFVKKTEGGFRHPFFPSIAAMW